MNWENITYLNFGSAKQQKAYHCLNELQLFEKLKEYYPILTGSLPIDISIASSDLDISCKYQDADKFENRLLSLFKNESHFTIVQKEKDGYWVVIASFLYQDFEIEIYGSLFPVASQNAYRHMIIESRILRLLGEDFKHQIIQLKKDGLKTEPAFAHLLQISGDPYQSLLAFESLTDAEIMKLWE
ncbi:DUF4269 domain-containing protein [Ancylomarina longa]|uniref:DUF4269 domain-containing protein n=1 Tax=Ancylomarina longa TaxID=2487017 RepID=A0A434AFN4_9BACT|nr:DUF4269 domain-containing protein [Ancylomarina longa]RUT73189.1 DUF4269 domain-containing protein [Ancylomarina longa]